MNGQSITRLPIRLPDYPIIQFPCAEHPVGALDGARLLLEMFLGVVAEVGDEFRVVLDLRFFVRGADVVFACASRTSMLYCSECTMKSDIPRVIGSS